MRAWVERRSSVDGRQSCPVPSILRACVNSDASLQLERNGQGN